MAITQLEVVDSFQCADCLGPIIKARYLKTEKGGAIKEYQTSFHVRDQVQKVFKEAVQESWTWIEVNCHRCGQYWPNTLLEKTNYMTQAIFLGKMKGQ